MSDGDRITRRRVIEALDASGGNRARAAEILGVGRATLYRWLARFGLEEGPPQVIGGRYEVLRTLGEGAQGTVYLVADRVREDAPRALKLIDRDAVDAVARERLRAEFRALALLTHPSVVGVHDFGTDATSGRPFLVMDVVEGRPFAAAAQGQPLEWILTAFAATLEAVDFLHRHNLLHRDLKSENVLVAGGPNGTPRVTVMDLGLSESLAGPRQAPGGTLLYAAPEVLAGGRASVRSDLYALGVLLYLALTGDYPFSAHTIEEALGSERVAPAPPSTRRPGLTRRLDALVLRLLAADPAARTPDAGTALADLAPFVAAAPLRAAARDAYAFVGRDEDLARALAAVDADHGPPALALLGDAGIGKSALLDALADELRARGVRVARGSCPAAPGQGIAAMEQLLAEALHGADGRGSTREDELVRAHRETLTGIVPFLGGNAPAGAAGAGRQAVLDALTELFLGLAGRGTFALVVDDMHCASPFVLDLAAALARRASGSGLRLVLAGRPPAAGNAWSAFLGDASAADLLATQKIDPLDGDAVRALAREAFGPARAALLGDDLLRLTGGNPFFLRAVLRDLAESAAIAPAGAALRLPESAQESVRALLHRSTPDELRLLEALATSFGPQRTADLAALAPGADGPLLVPLIERRMVVRQEDDRVDLAHAFVRDALLEELGPTGCRARHRAWAAVTARDPARLVEHAEHLLAAGVPDRAVFLAAAERLTQSFQQLAALPLLEAARATYDAGDPDLLALYPRLERLAKAVHDHARAATACAEWEALAQRLGDGRAEAEACARRAIALREQGEWRRALEAAHRAVALAEVLEDEGAKRFSEKILGTILWLSWDHAGALELLERSLSRSDPGTWPREHVERLHDIALLRLVAGREQSALDAIAESRRLFREMGDEVWALFTATNEGLILGFLGDLEQAVTTLRDAIDRLRAMGRTAPLEIMLENLVFILLRQGRYTEALQSAKELLDEALRFGRQGARISALLARGEALFQLDDRDAARDHHRVALDLATAHGVTSQVLFARLARARDHRVDGRLDAAEFDAREVLDEARRRRALRIVTAAGLELARVALERRDPAVAHAALDEAEEALLVRREDGHAQRAALLHERARARRLEGQDRRALADLEEGLGLARRCGPLDTEIRLLELGAATYEATGNSERAAALLHVAARRLEDVATRLGDEALRARWLGRPDNAALREAAARRGPPGGGAEPQPATDALADLYDISRGVAEGGDAAPLLVRIVELAMARAGAERGLLMLYDRETGDLVPAAATGIEAETAQDAIRFSRSVLERAGRGVSVLAADASSDPELASAVSVALFGIRSVMCVPLRFGHEVFGTLYVDTRTANAFFNESDLRYLEALADQAAVAMAYGRLVERLSSERRALQRTAIEAHRFGQIIGRSPAMKRAFELLEKVSGTDLPVIVVGASGTGKELVARALHFNSPRREKPFLSENCAAIPETLLETLLFGHVRGAFTGADTDRAGLFVQANGGTLFLDEIGDMSPGLQAKLLRVLQEMEFRPVGSDQAVRVDVRIIAATHRDLEALVALGQFRQDLYFRLNGVTVALPPLADRREDVPLLFRHFVERECAKDGAPLPEIDPTVLRALAAYDWPGNVRELQNIARRALIFAAGGPLDVAALSADPQLAPLLARAVPPPRPRTAAPAPRTPRPQDPLDASSALGLRRALDAAGGNRDKAARLLGVSRATLFRRLKEHGLLSRDS